MNLALRLKLAKQQGEKLVEELGITSLEVDPYAIAQQCDIIVQPKPDTVEGVSGMLLRKGNNFGIMYATHLDNDGFERFSVAHELGHYFLEGHPEAVLGDSGIHQSRAGFVTADPYELEADNFAAGLLMPSQLFRSLLRRKDPGLETVEQLAATCKTSLTATAIRYAELTDDAVAVIVSTGNSIDYCILSETMKTLKGIRWIKRATPVPSETATSRLNSQPDRITAGEREHADFDIRDWLGGDRFVTAEEEVVGLGRYGKTLTILTCPTLQEPGYQDSVEDDEDDDEMIDQWTPRFRR